MDPDLIDDLVELDASLIEPEPTTEELAQATMDSTFRQTTVPGLQILSGAEEDLTINPLSMTGAERRESYAERLRLVEARDADLIPKAREQRLRVNENVTPAGLVLPVNNEDYINLARASHTNDEAALTEFKKKGYLSVRPLDPDNLPSVIIPESNSTIN
jgi:hypothetical protein